VFAQHRGRVSTTTTYSGDVSYRDVHGLRTVIFMSTAAAGGFVGDAMITGPKTHDVDTAADEIRAFFEDDHVHMALIVAADRRLVTTIERPDLCARPSGLALASKLGTLTGRTVSPSAALDAATEVLLRERRRRLAVVDDRGCLLGLLCLKKTGTGYCSDDDVRERSAGASDRG
jgi:CBS-domain-containing membrane protein